MTAVAANGITIEYETRGAPDAPAMILVRGLGTQLIHWPEDLLDRLVAMGFFVVVFDNRDVGLSSKISKGGKVDLSDLMDKLAAGESVAAPYGLDDMARDTLGLMAALGIGKAHIAGISLGGMVVQVLAAQHPDRLLSMASIMSSSGNPDLPPGDPKVMNQLLNRPADDADREEVVAAAVESAKMLASPGYPVPEADRRTMAERAYDRCYYPDGVSRQFAAARAGGSRVELLRTISLPAQVIHGVDDPLLPIAGGEDTAANIPGAEFHPVPGMGHETTAPLAPILAELIGGFALGVPD